MAGDVPPAEPAPYIGGSPSTIRHLPYPIDIGYATCLLLVEFVIDGGLDQRGKGSE